MAEEETTATNTQPEPAAKQNTDQGDDQTAQPDTDQPVPSPQPNPPPEQNTQDPATEQSDPQTLQEPSAQSNEQPPTQPPSIPQQDAMMMSDPAFMNDNPEMVQYDPNGMMNGYAMNYDPNFMGAAMDPMQFPMMQIPQMQPMSADEIALYDRQIRLWGVQAQEKIRSANILLVGMKALGTEIAKNLVLAGVGTLTILDGEVITEDDLGSQFLISEEHVGQVRALAAQPELQKLNPRVNLFVDPDIIFSKEHEYFSSFDITIVTGLPYGAIDYINKACRMFGRKFYAADLHGMYGYIFSDLILHEYVIEKEQSNKPTKVGAENQTRSVMGVTVRNDDKKKIETVQKQEIYVPMELAHKCPLHPDLTKTVSKRKKITPLISCFRAVLEFQGKTGRLPGHSRQDLMVFTGLLNEKHKELDLPPETLDSNFLRTFLQNLGGEIGPAAAYLGGYLAQDVINVLGQREQPLQNFFFFDGENCSSATYSLQPIIDQSVMDMNMSMTTNTNGNVTSNGTDLTADVGGSTEMNGTAATEGQTIS